MTTVRFLMRWFYDKSARTKPRVEVTPTMPIKVRSVPPLKKETREVQIKWGNPVRWYF